MSFHSLERLLEDLERQPGWEQYRLYRQTLQSWSTLVGPNLARVSRPVKLVRNVLYVATSSSVVAQDLTMKRYDLLEQIDRHLQANFVDLRFSPAKWHAHQSRFLSTNQARKQAIIQDKVNKNTTSLNSHPDSDLNPQTALERLTKVIQQRCRDLPLCPSCQSATPIAELDRWQVCACCAARNWSDH